MWGWRKKSEVLLESKKKVERVEAWSERNVGYMPVCDTTLLSGIGQIT